MATKPFMNKKGFAYHTLLERILDSSLAEHNGK